MGRAFQVLAIHKQMFPATYNFRDEANGTEGDDIGFIDSYDETGDPYIKIIASKDGHKKVLEFQKNRKNTSMKPLNL